MLKVTETIQTRDWEDRYEVEIEEDGTKIDGFHAGPLCECPEDATLGRDLHYAYSAVEFFKLGYEAGKAGKEVEFVVRELGPEEEF